ncbi:LodA/GoxA family CTQ-dependent oxidase [Mycobacterium sp. OAE908]|uniref:LodA/GoxA family CTQ-dependent oxidase n=1 Tax=Mycobacterium sp. OAE908 TaxID=2817899 RepID=UPI001AE79D68
MIVRARIHPGIGIARIGDSTTDFTIGPEVIGAPATESLRDASGALKRQAARFRVYGIDETGAVVSELTSETAEITWTVHVANRKAAWYRFTAALDIPDAATAQCPRRNQNIRGSARQSLVIDPGPKSIAGQSQSGKPEFKLDGGKFKDVEVALGELRTDEDGRLLVFGAHGVSHSASDAPLYNPDDPDSFNNADDWYDDTADGPVTAEVVIDGRRIPVDDAWVVVTPPNYAPEVISWRTMTDLLIDLYVENGWLPKPDAVHFHADVLPVLSRLSNLQWVNAGFASMFGRGRPMDFADPAFIDRLATPPTGGSDPYRELRLQLLNAFRPRASTVNEPRLWPWIYGDAFGSFDAASPRNSLALPPLQAWILGEWAHGRFERDTAPKPLTEIEQAPIADQPDILDRAALTYCLADAFHPGCELTWPMRRISLYSSPFRIRSRPPTDRERDLGPQLTQTNALSLDGPLYAQPPGGLTRWMALPWQGDTAFCRSGYEPEFDPYLPTFWPARVPNQVLTEQSYQIAVDPTKPREQRLAAYNSRDAWLRKLISDGAGVAEVMARMIDEFGSLGVIEAREGVADDPDLPPVMYVENLAAHVTDALRAAGLAAEILAPSPDPVVRAGWGSEEQFHEFRSVRIRHR